MLVLALAVQVAQEVGVVVGGDRAARLAAAGSRAGVLTAGAMPRRWMTRTSR